jgi:hypothetical protein
LLLVHLKRGHLRSPAAEQTPAGVMRSA